MRKKLLLITAFCLCALVLAGCGSKENASSENESSAAETTAETQSIDREAVPFEKTVGVWTYGEDILFHSKDGNRYQLKEDSSGTVQDKDGKTYAVSECEYKLIKIMNQTDDVINVREGRYSEKFLGSDDYPDGYKTMVISYKKSDLFDTEKLEEAVKGGTAPANAETEVQTEAETLPSETEVQTETETPTETETVLQTETETQASESESETETAAETAQASEIPADAEYAAIYKKVQDFLETDNYKQKDPGNRSLEIFNYLHNLADSNIEEASIKNDTDKNEVSFKCYEKYTITINNTDGTVTVSE